MIGYSDEHLAHKVTVLHLDGHLGILCFYLKNRSKLAHRKSEILLLFWIMIAINMLTKHRIDKSALIYVKGQLKSNKCSFIKSKTLLFI